MNDSLPKASLEHTKKLAYENWVRRGRPFGSPEVDWFAAEKQLSEAQGATQDSNVSLYAYSLEPTES